MIAIFRDIIRLFSCILVEERSHDSCNDSDVTNIVEETDDSNIEQILAIQNILERVSDPATVKSMESTEGLVSIAVDVMNIECKHKKITDYKDQLLNDIAEVLVCDIRTSIFHCNDENVYCEENDYGETEDKYLENLQKYLKKKKEEIIKQRRINEEREELKRLQSIRVYYEDEITNKEKRIEEILTMLILCRVITMKTEELVEFVEKGRLLTGDRDFAVTINKFVRVQFNRRVMFPVFEKIFEHHPENLSQLLSSAEAMNPLIEYKATDDTLSDEILERFRGIVLPKATIVLEKQLRQYFDMKKSTWIEADANRIIRIVINGAEPELFDTLLACLEKKIYSDFPIYEICLRDIDFREKDDLMKIAHGIMKRFTRIKFEECLFKNDEFDLSVLKFEDLNTIEELRLIKSCVKDIGFFRQPDYQSYSWINRIYFYLKFLLCKKAPDNLEVLGKLKVFGICGHDFKKIPGCVFKMKNLTELGIRRGGFLKEVSNKISNLKNLKTLSLSNNALDCIPNAITNLTNLKKLILKNNQIESINGNINNLSNLEILILDYNGLRWIPENLRFVLPNLRYLSMRKCNLCRPSDFIFYIKLSSRPLHFSLFSDHTDEYLLKLEKLDLSYNSIKKFPKEILMMKNLKKLILENNEIQLSSIQDAFTNTINPLPNLERLVLSRNCLRNFPLEILNITNLRELIMSNCYVCKVPESIKALTGLKKLDLSGNSLEQFPVEITKLSNLEYLDLSHNYAIRSQTKSNIGMLKKLRTLKIRRYYDVDLLCKEIGDLIDLRVLDLSYNVDLKLPEEIKSLVNLRELNLGCNLMRKLDKNISELPALRILDVNNNRIVSIPIEISKLSNLEYLDISGNNLNEIPATICELTSLKTLHINRINADDLPDKFSNLKNLRSLFMKNNGFKELPTSICRLPSLEVLDVSNNQITDLPPELKKLITLKVLNIYQEDMKKIPESIWGLVSLEKLEVNNNLVDARNKMIEQMISKIPPSVFKRRGLKVNRRNRPFIFLFPVERLI